MTRLRFSIVLMALMAMPAQNGLAMLGGGEEEAPGSPQEQASSSSEARRPLHDTDARERAFQDRANDQIRREDARRKRAALAASVALVALEAKNPQAAAEMRAEIEAAGPRWQPLSAEEQARVDAAVASGRAAIAAQPVRASELASDSAFASTSASASSSATASTSSSLTAAPAPARGALRRGTAVDARAIQESAVVARGARGENIYRPVYDEARVARADLGRTEAPAEIQDIRDAFRDNPTAGQRRAVFGAPGRRDALIDSIARADRTRAALRAPTVGRMPRDLAAALVEIADQRDGEVLVRSLASDETGVATDRQDDSVLADTIRHEQSLAALARAATAAAGDYKEKTRDDKKKEASLRGKLEALATGAEEDRRKLADFLKDTLEGYPQAFAEVQLRPGQLAGRVGAGMTSAPRLVRYDFGTGIVRVQGPHTAVFKPSEQELNASGGLESTGVALSFRGDLERNTIPMRLEQRAVATRRVAEALGIGALVVDTRVARLDAGDGAAPVIGVVMERAPGTPGIEDTRLVPAPQSVIDSYRNLEDQAKEVEKMLTAFDSGLSFRPKVPLVDQAKGSTANWTRAQWETYKGELETNKGISGIMPVVRNGQVEYQGIVQERTVTDAQLSDPDLRRQLANAQWLDMLCGQVDRHPGNYYIDAASRPPVLKLIDNDMSFGPNNRAYGIDTEAPKFRIPPKPLVIDRDLKRAILGLDRTQLREATAGLLTRAEQDALEGRLDILRAYINSGRVVEVYPPGQQPPNGLSWNMPQGLLFRGADRGEIDPRDGEYSYYGILKAFPLRGQP